MSEHIRDNGSRQQWELRRSRSPAGPTPKVTGWAAGRDPQASPHDRSTPFRRCYAEQATPGRSPAVGGPLIVTA
ncbi:MAG TPA: hypothetical protein VIV88_07890 [Gemmatimonadales bacterium]